MNLKEIKELIDLLKDTDVSELELEKAGVRVRIKKCASEPGRQYVVEHTVPVAVTHAANPQQPASQATPDAEVSEGASKNVVVVASPIVGTFYRSPTPEAPSYVEVGDTVKKGQILCIIEAMKLMNEIEAEVSGKVVTVLAGNAQPVEYGEPLFHIEPV